jgi:hypothetical protein
MVVIAKFRKMLFPHKMQCVVEMFLGEVAKKKSGQHLGMNIRNDFSFFSRIE